jgi:GAF domain-containing protein
MIMSSSGFRHSSQRLRPGERTQAQGALQCAEGKYEAGADRALLICPRSDKLLIYAEATVHGEDLDVHLREREASSAVPLPESLVRYSLRTGEAVVLDDASFQNSFPADPYIVQRHARPILCFRMINQGRFVASSTLKTI